MKRIFLVDDHPLLREGLHRMITQMPDCEVCGESANTADALELIGNLSPDLVMLDITLPDRSGLDFVRDLKERFPQLPVLVFSMHDEMLYAVRSLRAGARGYLMKGTSAEILENAIRRVIAGERYLSARVCEHFLGNLSVKSTKAALGPKALTEREREIFEAIGGGQSNSQIADRLSISSKTVDAHRANIRTKLALPDTNALNRAAIMWVEIGRDD